jgi:hypothetical protein
MADRERGDYWKQRFVSLLKRIAFRIGIVVMLITFELLVFFGIVLLALFVEKVPDFFVDFADTVVLLAFISVHLLFLFFAVYPPKKWRDRWMQKDAERWLREKRATGYRPSPIVRRIMRQTIWAPILFTILVLLFLPELLGVWTQRNLPRPVTISGHPIRVPRTWIFFGQDRTGEGPEYINLIILKGAGTGKIRDWWRGNPPIADFRLESQVKKPLAYFEDARFLRTITNEGLELQCWQRHLHYEAVMIDCFSANGEMSAEFYGNVIYLEDFYAAIEK